MAATRSAIGKSIVRGEGPDKVSGKAIYAADISQPGMLWGRVLRSPYPYARIVSIDKSQAEALPGVHAVVTGQDIPDTKIGRRMVDMPILARDVVRFVGEKVAAVAADDKDAADEALLLIDVVYEELTPVYDAEEAMGVDAPDLHPDMESYQGFPQPPSGIKNAFAHITWEKGDIKQGFKESDLIFEHTFNAQLMHQAYIEPHACLVSADPAGKGVQIWANNKDPYMLRDQLAHTWSVPAESIVLYPSTIGGDFGGKGSFMDVPLCYYLSKASGRPVKMVMDYIQELMAGNPRHPAVMTIKTGVMKDGTIKARQARAVFDSGAYGAFKPTVYLRGADHLCGVYKVPHAKIDSYTVYTNNVPRGHMRSPAKPQVVFAVESHMDMIAQELGMDAYQFRLKNVMREGDSSPIGHHWQQIKALETLEAAAKAAGIDQQLPPNTGRGMAMTDLVQGTGQFAAKISLNEDGDPQLHMAFWDTGTGSHTVLRQMVAEELTLDTEDVQIVLESTAKMPYSSGSGGSRVMHTAGRAVVNAAIELRGKLVEAASPLLDAPEDQVSMQNGRLVAAGRSVTIAEVVARTGGASLTGEAILTSEMPELTSFCTQIAEVHVDPETGEITVNRFITAHDIGAILNPLNHQGQVEGGMIQGLGYALMEELELEDGHISTLSFGDYKIPTSADVPVLETVLIEGDAGPAPYESKGIGESSNIPVAGAIANAVFDAVGVRITDLPVTADKVLAGLRGNRAGN
ncbi:MAG: xanthine dehydrogenase family protein molybdopterin-binding subunit [SAR202 cluster bacterium]|nr:xanthine dehydrogenase family protein molybdopterin-binding subunit [SAR202 cluster bacterium]MQG78534.1 xanthine dehydrogenase family protein molybdopterin-binding subunit [SAR202 cluster bacterium]|tara:strand:- start:1395 stop:3626 length:2232 start_codon:yes stop_codon:yes gene_type:complete